MFKTAKNQNITGAACCETNVTENVVTGGTYANGIGNSACGI